MVFSGIPTPLLFGQHYQTPHRDAFCGNLQKANTKTIKEKFQNMKQAEQKERLRKYDLPTDVQKCW